MRPIVATWPWRERRHQPRAVRIDELPAAQPESGIGRKPQIDPARHARGPVRLSLPRRLPGQVAKLMMVGRAGHEAAGPAGHVIGGRERAALEPIAGDVGNDEVVEAVVLSHPGVLDRFSAR